MKHVKNKIALISFSLSGGGAERFSALLSSVLNDLGYEIHNIVINEEVDYEYCGTLYNLGTVSKKSSFWSRKIAKGFFLNKYLKEKEIDIIIDNRSRNVFLRELMAKWIYGKRSVFYMVHSYNLDNYFPSQKVFAKMLYKRASKLICVSKAIEDQVQSKYGFNNTITIYNPIDFSKIKIEDSIKTSGKYVLFFGRIEEKSKNFSLMLEAFSISKIYEKGYQLVIMGDGPDAAFVESKIQEMNLSTSVKQIPYQKHPFDYVKNAKFTLLTSHYEGFPMAIIESLALGTPVVSVNCNSGPAEVIQNEYNGLLVENYNPNALANAMERLINSQDLYHICKVNASKSVQQLSVEHISKQWNQILIEA
jgi:glycosyltransferase involved in cell wall biosynthesis